MDKITDVALFHRYTAWGQCIFLLQDDFKLATIFIKIFFTILTVEL